MQKRSLLAEPNRHTIVATNVINAPRDVVFKVMNDPATIPLWWGPRGLTTTVDRMDCRAGGTWRYVVRNEKGDEWAFHGVYHTIEAPLRTVSTFEWEGMPGHVSLETTAYEEHESGTKLVTTSIFQTIEDRDGMIASGMQDGANESMDQLEELLAKLQAVS